GWGDEGPGAAAELRARRHEAPRHGREGPGPAHAAELPRLAPVDRSRAALPGGGRRMAGGGRRGAALGPGAVAGPARSLLPAAAGAAAVPSRPAPRPARHTDRRPRGWGALPSALAARGGGAGVGDRALRHQRAAAAPRRG